MGSVWDDFTGKSARDAAEDANNQQMGMNQASLDAQTAANAKNLDFQKVLAYLSAMQGNQTNAQGLAATLGSQQQGFDQFAQLYNQDMTRCRRSLRSCRCRGCRATNSRPHSTRPN